MLNNISGIYCILNIKTNKAYIGSAVNISKRWILHLHQLRKNKHYNKYLQNSWNKYGEENFKFEILEYCNKEELLTKEQFWIDWLSPKYNRALIAGSRLGVKLSDGTKLKLSLLHKGKPKSEEHKLKIKQQDKSYNRNKNKWPHIDGYKCKCMECKDTRNFIGREYRSKQKTFIPEIMKGFQYAI